jgi:hypothetical protein
MRGLFSAMPKLKKLNIKISVFRTKMRDFPACAGKVISDSNAPLSFHDLKRLLWPMRTTKRI